MQLLDRDIHLARALIIDANPTARSVLAGQLRDLGVQQVRQMSRVQDARTVLEEAPHDIVLCEMNFEGAAMSGQDLLDELRREQLLPYSTAFILVTGDASYAQVQEAAEATVDGFLVKPCSGLALAERLTEVRRRKRTLKAIYEAIQARELLRAAALAEQRFVARDSYWSLPVGAGWLRTDAQRALKIGP
jgi:CheY-like chemotaxis protein